MYNPNNPSDTQGQPGENKAYLIYGLAWQTYLKHNGIVNLGSPLEDRRAVGSGFEQEFENGMIVSTDGTTAHIEDTSEETVQNQNVTIDPDPPTAETWSNGEKLGEGKFTVALLEGYDYDLKYKEDGYVVGEETITVPTSSSETSPSLTAGDDSNPEDWPLTLEAENAFEGLGTEITGGMRLTSINYYIGTQPWMEFPETGWVLAEVKAKAGGQFGGEWPYIRLHAFGPYNNQEVNSTSWISLFYLFEVVQSVDWWVEIAISDQSQGTAGFQVDIDYVTFTYVPGDYVPPVANNDQSDIKINVDDQDINVLSNDTDDSDVDETSVEIITEPENGDATVNSTTGVITYSPDTDFSGDDSLEYTVKDDEGIISKTGKAKVGVKEIIVHEPNGGESYSYGQWVDVSWWKDSGITACRVEWSVDDGENWTLAGTVFNDTTESFRNLQMYDKQCIVRVKNNYDYDEYDLSDASFTLEGLHGAAKIGVIDDDKVIEEAEIPETFALHEAYPNPFNPETVIPYDIPEASLVSIKIYNTLGQLVRTLRNGHAEAGAHRVIWNGKDNNGKQMPSGKYICQMKAENYTDSKMLTVIK